MKHLIVCREYPPAPSGGIGIYVWHIARLLAEHGETVHVIGQMWEGACQSIEEQQQGRLIVHRLPFENWRSISGSSAHGEIVDPTARALFHLPNRTACFSHQVANLAEHLVRTEGIDVIEAQEYEAPLYDYLTRRILGLSRGPTVPVIVHLHSPTEFIAQHNDWDMTLPQVVTARRLETFSITAADFNLCPSTYLARQVSERFGIASSKIRVIPLPIGGNAPVSRKDDTWRTGAITYLGRLERRKGILEWIQAAVKIAKERSDLTFEFIGDNVLGTYRLSGEDWLHHLIPSSLRPRFIFHGAKARHELPPLLARARIMVVPSRWENFPNTCVEAMSSGAPVLASPNGGMTEMISDGNNGWIATSASAEGLAAALRRAVATSPEQLAQMGKTASKDIRTLCDNEQIVSEHMRLRGELVKRGATTSLRLPQRMPGAASGSVLSSLNLHEKSHRRGSQGIGLIVTLSSRDREANQCLESIERQSLQPTVGVISYDAAAYHRAEEKISAFVQRGWIVAPRENGEITNARNNAIQKIEASHGTPLAYVFVDGHLRLSPEYLESCQAILDRHHEVGIVSCWQAIEDGNHSVVCHPFPEFPYQWVTNEVVSFAAVRAVALRSAGTLRSELYGGYEMWDLFNAILLAGWRAVTIPAVLGRTTRAEQAPRLFPDDHFHGRMRRYLLARYTQHLAPELREIIGLAESNTARNLQDELGGLHEQLHRARMALRTPRTSTVKLLKKLSQKLRTT